MRKALFTLALLAPALTIPKTAHADTIDDFVLVGGGYTIAFSLPASFTAPKPLTSGVGRSDKYPLIREWRRWLFGKHGILSSNISL